MIVVELSPLEARAHKLTEGLEDSQIEGALALDALAQSGLPYQEAVARMAPMVAAAKSARRKIAEATQYEIRVIGGEA